MMPRKAESLLQDAGRSREVFLGWVCAAISAAFAILIIWLLYLVAWRNPREFGAHDIYKPTTLVILGVLLAISVGFSILASRLIRPRRDHSALLSPLLLRMWGAFFALGSLVVLVHAIVTKSWLQGAHSWTLLGTSISMACAAFILARRRERGQATQSSMGQQDGAANGSQPLRSDTNRTPSAAGSRQ
jgi:hypothetical protein